jgi:DNA-binding NarL/FixJ family response regulator
MEERGPDRPILLVDNEREALEFMRGVLHKAGYATFAASSGEEALDAVGDEMPWLVILDVCLPGISGYEVCRELRRRFGDGLPIIFASSLRTESYDRVAGLLLGGDEYLTKPVAADELVIRVERLMRRSVPVDPSVTRRLTTRELEVLRLLAEGCSVREVASRLFITEKTVSTHIDHILVKLGVHSRAQAVAVAYRREIVKA